MVTISEKVKIEFSRHYVQFKEFQQNPDYKPYWDKCMEAVCDEELLSHIVFCNDIFTIPPIKTFLTYYKDDFVAITGDPIARLEPFVKKSMGAFWGMVFKFVLGYTGQKSVSASIPEYFGIKTATCFIKNKGEVLL